MIVGGGLAGMAAADALVETHSARFRVTLLEAKRTMGGRAGSFTDPESGGPVDYCQHVAMGCCTNFLSLLDRHGLSDRITRYRELQFLHPDHPPSRFAPSRWLPAPLHLASTIGGLRYLTPRQKWQVRRGLWRLMRTPPDLPTNLTARQWLANVGQDAKTIELFWDIVLVSALGEQSDRVAMSAARKVFIDGFAASRGSSDVCVPTRPLSQLIGCDLARSIAALGVEVVEGCTVSKIDVGTDSTLRVFTAENFNFDASHVIVAVPWYRIESLFNDSTVASALPDLASWTRLPTSPITGIHLWFDRPIMTSPHAVMVGTTAQWIFRDPLVPSVESDRFYYQVVVSASQSDRPRSRDQLVETVLTEIADAFPQARSAKLLFSRVVRDPRSVFSVSPEVERIRPSARTALPCLHLAGDWINTGWPATMEGAVIGGRMAAASVMATENLAPCPINAGLPRGWLARRLIRGR